MLSDWFEIYTFLCFSSDCPGDEDEKDCDGKKCKDWQFTCGNGHCIFQTWRCDNETDCPDGTDEVNCPASTTETPNIPEPVFPKG